MSTSLLPTDHCSAAFPPGRRWLPYTHVARERFGRPVYKIGLDAGFTCPNIDGTLAKGGCTYCDNTGFSPGARSGGAPLGEQIARGQAFLRRRFGAEAFIAYFQAYTNTHGRPVAELRALYDAALAYEDMVGLSVGTRPDCVPDPVLDLLATYQPAYDVMLELGLQSMHDETLRRVNRWHTFAQFTDAVERAQVRGLPLCVHVMLGLPGETHADMMATADALAPLGIAAIKIHLTHVMKDTVLERQYVRGDVTPFTFDAYARTVADFLERLPATVAIERLTAGAPREQLVAPDWANEKQRIHAAIHAELERRDSYQGARVRTPVG